MLCIHITVISLITSYLRKLCFKNKYGKFIVDNKWKSIFQIVLKLYRNPSKSTSAPRNFSHMLINKDEVIHIIHEISE